MEILFDYLESPTISDVPFRRVQRRYPENFNRVLDFYREDIDAAIENVDDLMREFKPETFDKLPGTVVILDPEIRRIAHGGSDDSKRHSWQTTYPSSSFPMREHESEERRPTVKKPFMNGH